MAAVSRTFVAAYRSVDQQMVYAPVTAEQVSRLRATGHLVAVRRVRGAGGGR
jgi:hypothetical protein